MRISDWSSDVCSSDLASLKDLREHISVVWHELFSDVPVSSRELDAVLHIVMAALRGSAFASGSRITAPIHSRGSLLPAASRRRSAESRVGKEWVRTCRFRGWPYN